MIITDVGHKSIMEPLRPKHLGSKVLMSLELFWQVGKYLINKIHNFKLSNHN